MENTFIYNGVFVVDESLGTKIRWGQCSGCKIELSESDFEQHKKNCSSHPPKLSEPMRFQHITNHIPFSKSRIPKTSVESINKVENIDSKVLTICPECQNLVKKENLSKHLENKCPSEVKSKTFKSRLGKPKHKQTQIKSSVTPSSLIICPECQTKIKKENLSKHLENKCPKTRKFTTNQSTVSRSLQKQTQTKNVNKLSLDQFIICSDCKVSVKQKNLTKHQKKCKGTSQNGKLSKQTKTQRKPSNSNSVSARSISSYRRSRNPKKTNISLDQLVELGDIRSDASGDYYYIKRENGKFGSHPLYDDYSEDSNP